MFDALPDFLGLPVLASEHGAKIDDMLYMIHIVMFAAFIIWGLFFVVPLIRYRKGKRPQAAYRGLRSWVPYIMCGLMAAIEGFILVNYSIPFWDEHVAAETVVSPDTFQVRVVGQQFTWIIHYPGPDGVFGRTSVDFIDDFYNLVGIDPDDPAGADDITAQRQLHLPVNRPVRVMLSSKDVIHSFSLPEFRVKQDAIPGLVMPIRFTPTMTSEEFLALPGNEERGGFEIVCAQLCGILHYSMRGFVTVETQEQFDEWYAGELDSKAFSDF